MNYMSSVDHLRILLIFHSRMRGSESSPSKRLMYLVMFLLALAIAKVTRARSTNLRSFLSGFYDLAA